MRRARNERRKIVLLLAVATLAAGISTAAYATHLLRRSELQTVDARFAIRGTQKPPSDIVFVAIESATFDELEAAGKKAEFPFPRRYDAEVIDRLREAGAKTIAMDMEFTHETDPTDDNALIEAIGRARGKVVLATESVALGGRTKVLGGEPLLSELGARPAEVLLTVDSDGSIRRFAHAYNGLGSFGVVTAEVATGHRVHARTFENGTLMIDYAGGPGSIHRISYAKVLRGEFSPSLFRNKIVIVGASAPILQDVHTTPMSGSEKMPGPEIWANATSTLLRGAPLRNVSGWLNVALIVLLAIAVPIGSMRVSRWRSLIDAIALAVVFSIAAQLAFNSGKVITFVYPMLALVLGTLGTLLVLYVGETIERERVRGLFARFVPERVVDDVLATTDENLRLGAVERDCTVLFSDLRGFTSFSETQPAARVIDVVNYYLNEMTEAILDAGGTLIAYMGDGIMAVFGAPLEQDDHADRALAAAREMIGPRLAHFNAWLAEQGFEHSFRMGIGLNSGTVMAGNVGSEQRVEYTALGDTTNTASRLEGMTKGSGHMLFVADSTRERIRRSKETLVAVGDLEVRGRTAKLRVWTLAEHPAEHARGVTSAGAEGEPRELAEVAVGNGSAADPAARADAHSDGKLPAAEAPGTGAKQRT
jgi:adenylate cyclase